ncbi:glycosyl hydrolase family 28-related protein [Planococcus shenhongbingii]|uniref:Glycosyl hydrolase family 28-related protein n=1 Tax=Planococcus shenhongbingii TaxID=3058398 RepID=A0ABT8N9P0_9BACL|nr:glycosyl hydrolase family 28-related protein [Planococcus sp. N017]MDN7244605.1 glycosyl hydrolase family 28-related protein [Planococcus sp. N017]
MAFRPKQGKLFGNQSGKAEILNNSVESSLDGTYNVKSFGATGDGVSNDWQALQEAIDFVYQHPGGGALFFPPGLYRISQPLEVPEADPENTVSWIGHSFKSTVIAPSAPMDYLVRMRGGGGAIQGIKFRGTDPMNGYAQYAKVCMLATDIRDKTFSNAAFVWGAVHGLQITGDGNNNLCVFDRLCVFSQNGTVIKGADGSGRADKVKFRHFNPKANDVHVGAYFKIGSGEGSVYHIDAVTLDSITISPDLKSPLEPGMEYAIYVGCGLQTDRGSDNNVYGIYDCHFVGNAGAGLMVRGLYGHHIQGGNFDSNGIAGIHIGSGMINTTPAYSNTINHAYFESNGYANVILDYPSGLTITEPLLAEPVDGTAGDIASITSLRRYYFDYDTTSISYNGRQYQYVAETDCGTPYLMEGTSQVAVDRPSGARSPAVIELPPAPMHQFGEKLEIFVEDSGGQPVHLVCEHARVNKQPGNRGVLVPAGIGFVITVYYNRRNSSWMVSHTVPVN